MVKVKEWVENLVIGGGPAGSMLAMRLADAGLSVTLLEKERSAHHKVCGEFLSRETVGYLQQAGLSPEELGAAPIRYVRLSAGRRSGEAVLPFQAYALSRYVLDAVMLERAEQRGCEVKRGACVERVDSQGGEWSVRLRDGRSMRAQHVFLANGKHDLHGWDRKAEQQSDLVGFKMHWQLNRTQTKSLRSVIELFLFPGGYGGLSLIETEIANLCLVVDRTRLRKLGGWPELLGSILSENPHLMQRMQGAEALWEKPLAISPLPYGYLSEKPGGIWRIGDQVAVIPSFTGDGMAIALHSAALAAEMHLNEKSADEYHAMLRSHLRRGMSISNALARAMISTTGRRVAAAGLQMFPNMMRGIASATRIPDNVLVRKVSSREMEPLRHSDRLA